MIHDVTHNRGSSGPSTSSGFSLGGDRIVLSSSILGFLLLLPLDFLLGGLEGGDESCQCAEELIGCYVGIFSKVGSKKFEFLCWGGGGKTKDIRLVQYFTNRDEICNLLHSLEAGGEFLESRFPLLHEFGHRRNESITGVSLAERNFVFHLLEACAQLRHV